MPSSKPDRAYPVISYYTVYLCSVLAVSLCLAAGLQFRFNSLFIIIVLSFLFLICELCARQPYILATALAGTALGLVYLSIFRIAILFNLAERVQLVILELIDHLAIGSAITKSNLPVLWTSAIVPLAIYTWLVVRNRLALWWIGLPFSAIVGSYWFSGLEIAWPMTVVLYLGLWYGHGIRQVSLPGRKLTDLTKNDEQKRAWQKTSLLFTALITLIALALPAIDNDNWLAESITQLFMIEARQGPANADETITQPSSTLDFFDLRSTGFQTDPARLGGPVQLGTDLVMQVVAPFPVYLRGNAKTRYENNNWHGSGLPAGPVDTQGSLAGSPGLSFVVKISNKRPSSSLFSPLHFDGIAADSFAFVRKDPDDNISLPEGVSAPSGYLVEAMLPYPYADTGHSGQELSTAEHRRLTELPSTVPPRVYKLAAEVTEKTSSPLAAAISLQNYLRENYRYTLQADYNPAGTDFVDYFLFESQQGYCTYFASALAILLRSIGIPARYVEGYYTRELVSGRSHPVSQDQAHAWVEAWLKPWGWVIMEATPAMPLIHLEAVLETLPDSGQSTSLQLDGVSLRKLLGTATAIILRLILISLAVFGLIVLPARTLYSKAVIRRWQNQLKDLPDEPRFIAAYELALRYLELAGLPAAKAETIHEFALRLQSSLFQSGESFLAVSHGYCASLYGSKTIKPELQTSLSELNLSFEKMAKAKMGMVRYWWHCYILNRLLPTLPENLKNQRRRQ